MGGNSPVRIDLSEESGWLPTTEFLSGLIAESGIFSNGCAILHGCGFASSIVAKEGGYLPIIEPQGESVHSQLVAMAVHFHQVLDVNAWLNVSWLLLNTHS